MLIPSGRLADTLGRKKVFLGGLALWRGATVLTEARQQATPRPLDGVGMGLLRAGIGALALSIVQSKSPTWTRTELLLATGTGLIGLAGFVAWARVASAPLVDLNRFRNTTYRYVNRATLTFGASFSMMFFTFFFYLTSVWHYSLPLAGVASHWVRCWQPRWRCCRAATGAASGSAPI